MNILNTILNKVLAFDETQEWGAQLALFHRRAYSECEVTKTFLDNSAALYGDLRAVDDKIAAATLQGTTASFDFLFLPNTWASANTMVQAGFNSIDGQRVTMAKSGILTSKGQVLRSDINKMEKLYSNSEGLPILMAETMTRAAYELLGKIEAQAATTLDGYRATAGGAGTLYPASVAPANYKEIALALQPTALDGILQESTDNYFSGKPTLLSTNSLLQTLNLVPAKYSAQNQFDQAQYIQSFDLRFSRKLPVIDPVNVKGTAYLINDGAVGMRTWIYDYIQNPDFQLADDDFMITSLGDILKVPALRDVKIGVYLRKVPNDSSADVALGTYGVTDVAFNMTLYTECVFNTAYPLAAGANGVVGYNFMKV